MHTRTHGRCPTAQQQVVNGMLHGATRLCLCFSQTCLGTAALVRCTAGLQHAHFLCLNPAIEADKYHECPLKVQVGALSLAMKHLRAYHDVVLNNYAAALILEDDFRLCPTFGTDMAAVLGSIAKSLPKVWDIVLLGTQDCGMQNRCPGGNNNNVYTFKKVPINRQATHAYLISLQGAMKMLQG